VTWNGGMQVELPYSFVLDASYVGQHSYDVMGNQGGTQAQNLNSIDLGSAYLPANQDPTYPASTYPGQYVLTNNLIRPYRGYADINEVRQVFYRTSHTMQFSLNRRFSKGFSAGVNWNWVLFDEGNYGTGYRFEHVNGELRIRADQAEYDELNKNMGTAVHYFKGNFVWDLPDLRGSSSAAKVAGYILNDWQLSGIWTAQTGTGYGISFGYDSQGGSVNLTGSPNFGAGIRIIGDTGSGCTNNQYAQFNTAAFIGPDYGSNGLESGRNYMRSCWSSIWDMAIARNIRMGGSRNFQLRIETYNTFNQAYVTSRSSSVTYNNPTQKVIQNSQYLADGSLDPNRLKPNQAGFGAVNGWSSPLTVQVQLRFQF